MIDGGQPGKRMNTFLYPAILKAPVIIRRDKFLKEICHGARRTPEVAFGCFRGVLIEERGIHESCYPS